MMSGLLWLTDEQMARGLSPIAPRVMVGGVLMAGGC